MDTLIKRWLKPGFSLESNIGQSGGGTPQYAEAETFDGFCIGREGVRITHQGLEVKIKNVLFVNETLAAKIKPKDRITLPGATQGFLVLDVQPYTNRLGVLDYAEVFL